MLVEVLERHTDIDGAQEAEDQGLNDADDKAEHHRGEGHQEDPKAEEDTEHLMIADHISKEAKGEAQRSRDVTDQLDNEDQRSEDEDRTHHVLEMLKTVGLNSIVMGR